MKNTMKYARIETNVFWQFDDTKWVLVLNDDKVNEGYCFKETGSINYPANTKRELKWVHSRGIIKETEL